MDLKLYPTTDFTLDWYSNSKLTAVNTCPRFGAVRFGEGKHFAGNSRAMPLEAGRAAHDGFAAVRLFQLYHHQRLPSHAVYRAQQLFGIDRAKTVLDHINKYPDVETQVTNMVLEALYTSGFYDDPDDKKRTVSNIEAGLLAYIRSYPFDAYPVYVEDHNKPDSIVGIEHFFDLTVESTEMDFRARYVGTMDGIHELNETRLLVEDNKTASRLDRAWQESLRTAHQFTGYMMSTMAITGRECNEGIIRGMSIPLPKGYDSGGIVDEPISRTPHQFGEWMRWFVDGVSTYRAYAGDPLSAPMFTHSCNRYFRPCSLIDFCVADHEDAIEMLEEMENAPLSPSEQSILAKTGD